MLVTLDIRLIAIPCSVSHCHNQGWGPVNSEIRASGRHSGAFNNPDLSLNFNHPKNSKHVEWIIFVRSSHKGRRSVVWSLWSVASVTRWQHSSMSWLEACAVTRQDHITKDYLPLLNTPLRLRINRPKSDGKYLERRKIFVELVEAWYTYCSTNPPTLHCNAIV